MTDTEHIWFKQEEEQRTVNMAAPPKNSSAKWLRKASSCRETDRIWQFSSIANLTVTNWQIYHNNFLIIGIAFYTFAPLFVRCCYFLNFFYFSFQRGGADSATGRPARPALKVFRASSSNWSQTIYICSVISKLRYVMKSHVQFYLLSLQELLRDKIPKWREDALDFGKARARGHQNWSDGWAEMTWPNLPGIDHLLVAPDWILGLLSFIAFK